MGLAMPPGLVASFDATEEGYLYDCHGGRFAPAGHGASATSGFVPLYLSQLFRVPIREWNARQAEVMQRFARDPDGTRTWIAQRLPPGNATTAAEAALLVYPAMERFIERCDDEHAPFRLRRPWLMQQNVALSTLRFRDRAGQDHPVVTGLDDGSRRRRARELMLALGRGALAPHSANALGVTALLAEAAAPTPPAPPGVYLCGHSSVLVRGSRRGLLIDPTFLGPGARAPRGLAPTLLSGQCDTVALTHLHFDHYHLPTLLALSDRTIVVPAVPEASLVAEDAAARLKDFGVPDVRAPVWGSRLELDEDLSLELLPFRGEQILTSESHPQARNWGNAYLVEAAGARVLIVADAGFEPGRSILDEVTALRARSGPVDAVVTQAAGMSVQLGGADADFQVAGLTCAHRAPEAFELLAFEHRVTLAPADIPALCRESGARHVLLHGQFTFDIGQPTASAQTRAAAARALSATPGVTLHDMTVGQGLALPALNHPVSLT